MLLPIITSPSFHVHGDVVHAALIRLADVLQVPFPYHPCDWYIYLHLVDYYGKLVGTKKTKHGSVLGFFGGKNGWGVLGSMMV